MGNASDSTLGHGDLNSWISHASTFAPDLTVSEAFDKFQKNPHRFAAVIEKGNVRLCARRSINYLMRNEELKAQYGNKQIGDFLIDHPEKAVNESRPMDLLERLVKREEDTFFDDIVILNNEGDFIGLIDMRTVLRNQVVLLKKMLGKSTQALPSNGATAPAKQGTGPVPPAAVPIGMTPGVSMPPLQAQPPQPLPGESPAAPTAPAAPPPPPAQAPSTEPEMDFDDDDDDDEFYFPPHLIKMFIDETTNRITDLESALEAGDSKTLNRGAHTIKGSAANFQAMELQEIAMKLEKFAGEERLDECAPLVGDLKTAFEGTKTRLATD